MNNKITLQDIIESLIQKHSMERKDAESFVKGMFELIENALATEKFVKIKGLGTFKLVDVDSRESINVNTGERFEIQGHSKVSFVPDPTLKNIINKPFAHFETVVLNEGTKLEDTDTVIENPANIVSDESSEEIRDNEIEIETESAGSIEHEKVEVTEPIITESIDSEIDEKADKETLEPEKANSEENEVVENAIVSENDNNTESIEVSETENVNEQHNEITDDKVETNENIEVSSSSETISKENNVELPNSENESEETVNEEKLNISEKDSSDEAIENKSVEPNVDESIHPDIINKGREHYIHDGEKKNNHTKIIILIIIAVAVIAIAVYAIICSTSSVNKNNDIVPSPVPAVSVPDSSLYKQDKCADSLTTGNSSNSTESANATSTIKDNKDIEKAASQPESNTGKDNSSAQTNNGVYNDSIKYKAVGTKTTHILKEGESIIKLSIKYYGTKKLWSYIVDYNKDEIGDNGDKVKIGTKVKIPELKPAL